MSVVMASSICHTEEPITFVIADCGLSAESRRMLEDVAGDVSFVHVEEKWTAAFPADLFPAPVFPRLFADRLLPEVERVIFLDGDLLVRGSLSPLAESTLEGTTIGAVPITGLGAPNNPPTAGGVARIGWPKPETTFDDTVWPRFGVPPCALQFNAGVMVIDLARWRGADVTGRLVAMARDARLNDQMYLNILFWSDWTPLDTRWNSKFDDTFIYHFAGPNKPWQPTYFHNPLLLEYVDAASRIGWTIPVEPRGATAHCRADRRSFVGASWTVSASPSRRVQRRAAAAS